jgi:putative DNA-invertase from lambdoid prophage Rac
MASNVRQVLELDRLGVLVVSVREPWLDTGGPVRDLLVAIFSWVAEQERLRLVERTRAGLARARREGTRLGRRRRMASSEIGRALAMRVEGRSVRAIAVALKVPRSTVARALSQKRVASPPSKVAGE